MTEDPITRKQPMDYRFNRFGGYGSVALVILAAFVVSAVFGL